MQTGHRVCVTGAKSAPAVDCLGCKHTMCIRMRQQQLVTHVHMAQTARAAGSATQCRQHVPISRPGLAAAAVQRYAPLALTCGCSSCPCHDVRAAPAAVIHIRTVLADAADIPAGAVAAARVLQMCLSLCWCLWWCTCCHLSTQHACPRRSGMVTSGS